MHVLAPPRIRRRPPRASIPFEDSHDFNQKTGLWEPRVFNRAFQVNQLDGFGAGGGIPGRIFFAPFISDLILIQGSGSATFTRATSQWARRAADDQLIESTSGNAAFEANGILLERAGTNIGLQSRTWATSPWSSTNMTTTNNNVDGPDGGTNNATTTRETAIDNQHRVFQNFTITANADVSYFVIGHHLGTDRLLWCQYVDTVGFTDKLGAYFETEGAGRIDIESPSGTGVHDNVYIQLLDDGYYLMVTNGNHGNSRTAIRLAFHMTTDTRVSSFLGDVNKGSNLFHVQMEDNVKFDTSMIVTTTASGTRNKTQLTYQSTDNLTASEGSIEFTADVRDAGVAMTFIDTRNGSLQQGVTIGMNSSGQIVAEVWTTTQQAALTATGDDMVLDTEKHIGLKWKDNEFTLYTSGIQRAQDTAGSAPASHSIFRFGELSDNTLPLTGHMKNAGSYNRVLGDSEFLALAA